MARQQHKDEDYGAFSADNAVIFALAVIEMGMVIAIGAAFLQRPIDILGIVVWLGVGGFAYVIYRVVHVFLMMSLATARAAERSARALEAIANRRRE